MKKSDFVILIGIIIVLFFPQSAFADSWENDLKRANKLSRKGKYEEALTVYNDLLEIKQDSDIANYNKGIILYKKKEFAKAIPYFIKALSAEEYQTEKEALFNIGNSYYRLSELSERDDLNTSIKLCSSAMEYYKRAMEVDSRDRRIKINYEVAGRRLKALRRKAGIVEDIPPKSGKKARSQQQKRRQEDQREQQKRQQEDQKKQQSRRSEDQRQQQKRRQEDQREQQKNQQEDQNTQKQRQSEDNQREQKRREEDIKDREDNALPQDQKSREDRQRKRDEQRRRR